MLNNLSIRNKLLLVLLVPALLAIVVIYLYLSQISNSVDKQKNIEHVVNISNVLANVAHNFAVERGLSAGFIGSKGASGSSKLESQHKKADASAEQLLTNIDDISRLAVNKQTSVLLAELKKQLALRQQVRQKVLGLAIDSNFFAFYSNINSTSLSLIEQMASYLTEPRLAADFQALLHLLWLKERAGQSRGALNGIFSKGDYSEQAAATVLAYIDDEQSHVDKFVQFANQNQLNEFNANLDEKTVAQVEALRKVFTDNVTIRTQTNQISKLIANGEISQQKITALTELMHEIQQLHTSSSGQQLTSIITSLQPGEVLDPQIKIQISQLLEQINLLQGVNAADWFKAATERIVKVNAVVELIANKIQLQAVNTLQQATLTYYLTLGLAVIAVALSLWLGFVVSNLIRRNLQAIQQVLADVRQNYQFAKRVEVDSEDEIGQTAADLNLFMNTLADTINDISQMSRKLADGQLSQAKLTKQYVGDLAVLANNLEDGVAQVRGGFTDIAKAMQAGREGDFSRQIKVELKGELNRVKQDINSTLATTQTSIDELAKLLSNLARGNLHTIDKTNLPGKFGELIKAGNQTVVTLDKVISQDVQSIINAANKGILTETIDVSDKQGCFAELSQGINSIMLINRQIVDEVAKVFNGLVHGRLDLTIDGAFQGKFAELQNNGNATSEKLRQVIELEIGEVVAKSNRGDLSGRIDTKQKQGFFLNLSSQINQVMQTNQQFISDLETVISGLSQGQLNLAVQGNYQGQYETLKQNTNKTITQLRQIIDVEMQSVINNVQAGELTTRIDQAGKPGSFGTLSQGINQIVDTMNTVMLGVNSIINSLVKGELHTRINANYQGEFARLKDNANLSMDKLTDVLLTVSQVADTVTNGVNEIAQANEDLRRRTELSAQALEETNSSVVQLNALAAESVKDIVSTEQLIGEIKLSATSSKEVVDNALQSMNAISNASKKIEAITSVIDEIAFQTNLLALNASVEAARAGEDGRGFSVVAAEVRNLAQRSAASASEIKALIADSVVKVGQGSKQVQRSSESLNAIVDSIFDASKKMSNVSSANQQQTHTLKEITMAIGNIEKGLQENAAMVEEVTSSTESLVSEADELNSAVSFFKLGNGQKMLTQF